MRIHKNLTYEHWFTFTLFEQLANVGTDVARVIYWRDHDDLESSRQAFDRALELLDATIADPKNRNHRLKELLRAREALIDYFLYDNEYCTSDRFWQDYFYQFNYAAAVQKGK